jgi:hypothetical protein
MFSDLASSSLMPESAHAGTIVAMEINEKAIIAYFRDIFIKKPLFLESFSLI